MQTLSNAGNSQINLEIPKCKNSQDETISRVDLAWLAGILEGEGHFVLYYSDNKTRMCSNIGVTNCDMRMIKKVGEIYSKLNIKYYYNLKSPSKNHSKKFTMMIIVGGFTSCRKLINAVLPYLVSKLDQAMTMVEYLNYRLSMWDSHKGQERSYHGYYKKTDNLKYGETDHIYWHKMRELKHPPIDPQRLQRKACQPLCWDDGIV